MPTRERAIKERGKSLQELLLAYRFPLSDAQYIAQKAVERGLVGQEFRTTVQTELLSGEVVVDISTMVCLSCTLRGSEEG